MEKLYELVTKPMIEQTWKEELIGVLIIFGVLAVIFGIGEIVYRLERWWKNKHGML